MRFKKIGLFCFSLVFILGLSCKQNEQRSTSDEVEECTDTYSEMADPTKDTLSDWSDVSKDLQASFVSIDKRYPKSVNPDIATENAHKVVGWKGETVSAQVLLWSADSVSQVKVDVSDFKGESNELSSDLAEASFVRYVMTDEFAEGCGHRKPEDFDASLSPDALDPINCMDLEGEEVRPVWLTLNIPKDAEAGIYNSTVKIVNEHSDAEDQELALELEVIDQTLPDPSEWKFHLDQWQHPSAVARVEGVELWSDEHFEAMKPVFKPLAETGQKVITATLNKDPWGVQTYDPYEDMIEWIKEEDGSWRYDYSVFDKWVEFMMDLGIDQQINAYSIIPWENEVHYKDVKADSMVVVETDPREPIFEEIWKPFLEDFSEHLEDKGWLERTNIALDERDPESMDAAFSLIDEVAPDLGVAFADNQKTYQDYPDSDDISVAVQHPFDKDDLKERKENDLITTFYIYCGNSFPNQFTFSDPAEANFLGWYALANGFDGFLRWAYNSWVEEPLKDSRFRTWPAGDTYTVYPGGRSSIRHERTREGIQDYEKVRIIKNKLEEEGKEEELKELDSAIEKLNDVQEPGDWNEHLNNAKQLLNKLSKG